MAGDDMNRTTTEVPDLPTRLKNRGEYEAAEEIERLRRCAKGKHEWDQLDRWSAKSCKVCGFYVGEPDR